MHVLDVTDENFQDAVIQESHKRMVLVDFWAPWCGPCRSLAPVLEQIAGEAGGAFLLAKLNTDTNPQTPATYAIRGIPAVKAFVEGVVVDEFTGALPEAQVRTFVQRFVKTPEQEQLERALRWVEDANLDAADEVAAAIAEQNPKNARAWRIRAEVAAQQARWDDAEAHVARAELGDEDTAVLAALRSRIQLGRLAGDDDAVEPDRAALQSAARAALGDGFDLGFTAALACVQRGAGPQKEAAKAVCLAILQLAPPELAREMRRRLSMVLY